MDERHRELASLRRSGTPDCEQFLTMQFVQLPGTAREVEEVADIWSLAALKSAAAYRGQGEALVLTGSEATESTFKAGANMRSAVPDGADDGILTADEILSLDLSG